MEVTIPLGLAILSFSLWACRGLCVLVCMAVPHSSQTLCATMVMRMLLARTGCVAPTLPVIISVIIHDRLWKLSVVIVAAWSRHLVFLSNCFPYWVVLHVNGALNIDLLQKLFQVPLALVPLAHRFHIRL